jgi:pimeloyl-ACP methyl ester carboxylesterase
LFATDVGESVRSVEAFVRLLFARAPSAEDAYAMLGYNLTVPPSVRQALFSRSFDCDDVMATIRKPVLIVHGAADAVVSPAVVEQHAAAMPHAQICVMPNAGHAPFWEDAQAFNEQLRTFCQGI